ncbi:hypothetical protein T265_02013 [Opisthorchis viverrini]|uniref:Uncharacterized protein n=1 Tax=Opisthorchis viverrini TaxID=6198 RepID=A0A075AIK2_OPIVI|nr:hypothetical protein T265_02013 [Opisthorchis viverrini]KER31779.1 hypothetical protein T265_02013 [Opisthorchis viverrini]
MKINKVVDGEKEIEMLLVTAKCAEIPSVPGDVELQERPKIVSYFRPEPNEQVVLKKDLPPLEEDRIPPCMQL